MTVSLGSTFGGSSAGRRPGGRGVGETVGLAGQGHRTHPVQPRARWLQLGGLGFGYVAPLHTHARLRERECAASRNTRQTHDCQCSAAGETVDHAVMDRTLPPITACRERVNPKFNPSAAVRHYPAHWSRCALGRATHALASSAILYSGLRPTPVKR